MAEYIPTTDEIREYVETGGEPRPWVELDEVEEAKEKARAEAFDRWLIAHDAEVRAGVVAEEPEWQYSYVERIGRHGDVHERVTFDSLESAEQYLRANADLIIGWNREVGKRDRKTAGVEKRQMNIGSWVPVKQEGAESDG